MLKLKSLFLNGEIQTRLCFSKVVEPENVIESSRITTEARLNLICRAVSSLLLTFEIVYIEFQE